MDLEKKAFERLRLGAEMSKQYYDAPLIICYSGGKDSDVLIQLAINSGIDFEVLHNHTTADAPETVRHICDTFKRLEPPTRIMRYCCSILKEKGGQHRAIATGVRWAESRARTNRGIYEDINWNKDKKIILNNDNDDKRLLFERCEKQAKTVVNPVIDWQEQDVWDYLKDNKTPCNPLYCEFSRVGCVGCPMASKGRYAEFRRYPEYKQMYIHAFDRMLEVRKQRGKTAKLTWQSGYDVFRWWMEEDFTQYEFTDEDFEEE